MDGKNILNFPAANVRKPDRYPVPPSAGGANARIPDKAETPCPTVLRDCLNALYPETCGDIRLEYEEGQPQAVNDLDAFLDEAGDAELYAYPVTASGETCFVYEFVANANPGEWASYTLQPTVVLERGSDMLCVWAIAEPTTDVTTVESLMGAMGGGYDEPLPAPGGEWSLAHCDAETFYDLTTLVETFGVDEQPASAATVERYRDAVCVTPFDPKDPRLDRVVALTFGASKMTKAGRWRTENVTLRQAFDFLTKHHERNTKDGPAVLLGAVAGGERTAGAIERLEFVGLDLDCGFPGEELRRRIAASGLMAAVYSTHTHLKRETREPIDSFVAWSRKAGFGDEVTGATARARLLAQGVLPDIADHATATVEKVGAGREVVISHPPIAKWRVVVPLKEPFVIADQGATDREGREAWRRAPQALAGLWGGLPIDRTGCDPNRLLYLPSHALGAPWECYIFGGEFFDADAALKASPQPDVRRTDGDGGTTGAIGKRWVARRADGFQVVDLIRDLAPERIRQDRGESAVIECPHDHAHGNAGDPNDQACFVQNAGAGAGDGFVWSCRHNSCASVDRLEMLNLAVEAAWFSADDVTGDEYDALDRSGESAAPLEGGVAVGGVLDGLDDFDPNRRIFEGDTACDDAIREIGKVVSVLTQGNRTRIAIRTRNGLVFNSKSDAVTRFDSYRAIYVGTDAKGNPKEKNLAALDLLLKSDQVRIYDGIDCNPTNSLPDHILNTWEGIAVAPEPGDCSRILAHIRDGICAGDETHTAVLLGFFAHMFQRPAEKPGFAPVVIGPKGCGKSTIGEFLCRAIGRKHSVKIAQAKHLTGAFNAHLAGKLFVQAEEVTFGGDKKNEGVLKDAITARSMLTEPKGLDAYQESNFSRFFLVTNPGHAVPASDGERRWFALQARDLFEGKAHDDPERVAYFKALYKEADSGGLEAFVHHLMALDISDFMPFAAPRTDALADQVRQSLSDEDLWVMGALQTGQFDTREGEPLGEPWLLSYTDKDGKPLQNPDGSKRVGMEIDAADLQRSFDSHVRRYGGSSGGSGACRAVLERHGGVEKKRRGSGMRQNFYVLGPRQEWRDAFTTRFGIALADEGEDEDS